MLLYSSDGYSCFQNLFSYLRILPPAELSCKLRSFSSVFLFYPFSGQLPWRGRGQPFLAEFQTKVQFETIMFRLQSNGLKKNISYFPILGKMFFCLNFLRKDSSSSLNYTSNALEVMSHKKCSMINQCSKGRHIHKQCLSGN